MESLREKIRKRLANRYRQDLETGTLTINGAKQMIVHLQTDLEKVKKTNRRIVVEGQEQLGSLSSIEIEDQISALKRIL
jgi:ribosomal protein L32E